MKSFKELLLESIAEYKMTVRFAGELSEEDINRMERFLGKYGLIEISSVNTTPIAKTNIFFDKSIMKYFLFSFFKVFLLLFL